MKKEEKKTEPVKTVSENEASDESITRANCVDLDGKLLHVRVGDENKPATNDDIVAMEENLEDLFKGIDCLVLVTHHAVSVEIIEKKNV